MYIGDSGSITIEVTPIFDFPRSFHIYVFQAWRPEMVARPCDVNKVSFDELGEFSSIDIIVIG